MERLNTLMRYITSHLRKMNIALMAHYNMTCNKPKILTKAFQKKAMKLQAAADKLAPKLHGDQNHHSVHDILEERAE